jgi:Holliday junction resolvase RusA-like endonuclease
MSNHSFRVYGTPKGQPRPRAFSRGGRAAVYDPGTAEGWKSLIAIACQELRGALIEGPVSVAMIFYMPRPKSHFTKSGAIKPAAPQQWHTSKPDADNLAKAVLDALTTLRVWHDDDQVAELMVRKHYESARVIGGNQIHPPGVFVNITDDSRHNDQEHLQREETE